MPAIQIGTNATYDPTTDAGVVRLLLNDATDPAVFTDAEVQAFLDLEGGVVKLAAAQAIDTNATNEVLASKVLKTPTLTTDGAKVADAMRAHAAALRQQVEDGDNGSYFEVIDFDQCVPAELAPYPHSYGYW